MRQVTCLFVYIRKNPRFTAFLDSNLHTQLAIVTENELGLAFPPKNYYTRLTALFPGLPGWAGTRKIKPIWILLKQETVSGSGISWAVCKSAPRSRQITVPAPHHSSFYRPDALPAAQPTASSTEPSQKFSSRSVHVLFSYRGNKQTNRQKTDRETDIPTLVKT